MKNDIFSFSRFGRYFRSEFASIFSGKGISILAFGLMPVYIFVLDILFSSFGYEYNYMYVSSRSIFFAIAGFIFVIWMPAACYGYITEKRAGSMFTLLPVSSLEKTLSMIINTMIIIPLSFLAIISRNIFCPGPADHSGRGQSCKGFDYVVFVYATFDCCGGVVFRHAAFRCQQHAVFPAGRGHFQKTQDRKDNTCSDGDFHRSLFRRDIGNKCHLHGLGNRCPHRH